MLGQIASFLVDTIVSILVLLLLARFWFQWARVPFHNPVGEFLLATTSWLVRPVRRVVPGVAGIDLSTLLLAWAVQALGLVLNFLIAGAEPRAAAIALIALVDMARLSLYILVFAVIVQAVFSWVNPGAPMAWIFDAITRPFLRPLRRFIPPVGRVDLTPLVLLVLLQVLLIPVAHLRVLAAGA